MSDPNWIWSLALAFATGWGLAYFFTNLSRLWDSHGLWFLIFGSLFFLALIMSAAIIADRRELVLSALLTFGFIMKFIQRYA